MIRKFFRFIFRGTLAVIALVLLAWAGTGLYFKTTDAGPWPAPVAVQPSGVFERETTCWFGGGYDEWQAMLRNRNGSFNPLGWILTKRFPREMYESAASTVDCRFLRYQSDGYAIGGYLLMPKDAGDKKLPVIVYNRGGNGSFGAMVFAEALYSLAPYAREGFLVVASQYRGFTDDEPEKYGFDEFGGKDVRDVEKLIELTAKLPNADMDNVFLLGASRGAMMNYLVARRHDDIRAIASINGGADLEKELAFRPEMERMYQGRIPDYATRKSEVLAERSVIRWAEELPRATPILLVQGGKDERVDPASGPALKARLDAIGHPNRMVVYPEDNHSLHQNWDKARGEIIAFFREHLRTPAGTATAAR